MIRSLRRRIRISFLGLAVKESPERLLRAWPCRTDSQRLSRWHVTSRLPKGPARPPGAALARPGSPALAHWGFCELLCRALGSAVSSAIRDPFPSGPDAQLGREMLVMPYQDQAAQNRTWGMKKASRGRGPLGREGVGHREGPDQAGTRPCVALWPERQAQPGPCCANS